MRITKAWWVVLLAVPMLSIGCSGLWLESGNDRFRGQSEYNGWPHIPGGAVTILAMLYFWVPQDFDTDGRIADSATLRLGDETVDMTMADQFSGASVVDGQTWLGFRDEGQDLTVEVLGSDLRVNIGGTEYNSLDLNESVSVTVENDLEGQFSGRVTGQIGNADGELIDVDFTF